MTDSVSKSSTNIHNNILLLQINPQSVIIYTENVISIWILIAFATIHNNMYCA